ncbi:MAG TPA: hypothetical protein VEA99_16085 [Gemmatimonadaceae bacterium]|nr:hypothetical protein [Gemmatimonadaceae bacterium]
MFTATAVFVLGLLAAGWIWTLAMARTLEARGISAPGLSPAGRAVSAGLTRPGAPSAAFLNEAALEMVSPLRGASGKLRARIQPAGQALPGDEEAHLVVTADGAVAGEAAATPVRPGLYRVSAAVGKALRPIAGFNVIALQPFSAKRSGRIGQYLLGSWPAEMGKSGPKKAPAGKYANPQGFIEVTRENQGTHVSEHFQLRHFLTKNQYDVWPKYLVLRPELIDKLELVLSDLQGQGIETKGVKVLSGFRTPSYNAGGGNTAGRANLSRHTYGDAADLYIDNDGNGSMDDLNRDGRVDIGDARVIDAAVDRVERAHPELVGGSGVYPTCCGHGPFIHIDTHGYRARWVGSGSG